MGIGRTWTPEEELFLEENWGTASIPVIAERLGRSVAAIKIRAVRLNLGPVLMGGDYVTLNQLSKAIGYDNSGYKIKSWVENRNLPVHKKRVEKCSFRVVYLDEFWEWVEKNRSFIDFSKFPSLALGVEPAWVDKQRKKDRMSNYLQRKDPWTPMEDSRLLSLLAEQRYGYQELSRLLHRSCGAIQRRCCDLKTKLRPVRVSTNQVWSEASYKILADGIRNGDGYALIGERIGKSEKAVRGKAYSMYLTEDADKIRHMLGNHPWGHGAPEPTIHQSMVLSGRKKKAQEAISELVGVLIFRRNSLAGWDAYFQRHMCQHWDDAKGCTAGEKECDSCLSFQRIRPQYCCRCGQTFIERDENKFCAACRLARKHAAQRKWKRERGDKENVRC